MSVDKGPDKLVLSIIGLVAGAGIIVGSIFIIKYGYSTDDFFKIVAYWVIGGIVFLVGVGAALFGLLSLLTVVTGNDDSD